MQQSDANPCSLSPESSVAASPASRSEPSESYVSLDTTRAGCDSEVDPGQAVDHPASGPCSVIDEETLPRSSPYTKPPSQPNEPAVQSKSILRTASSRSDPGEYSLSRQVSAHSEASKVSSESEPRGRAVQFHTRVTTVSPSPSSLASHDQLVSPRSQTRRRGLARRGSVPLSPPVLDDSSVFDFD